MVTIPKIIHQTWKDTTIPDKWKKSEIEWKRHHPLSSGWQYILWTDDDNRNLIKNDFPWFLDIYDNYPYPIQRVDTARYFILYKYGGIYSDLDIYPIKPVDEYFTSDNESYFVVSSNYKCFTNSFMASKPKAEIWNHIFKKLCNNHINWFIRKFSKHFTIMLSTGPMMVNNVILSICNTKVTGVLPKGFMNYIIGENVNENCLKKNTVLLPLKGSSWCSFDSHVLIFFNKNKSKLALLGIVSILIIIILLFVVLYKYINFKRLYKKCSKQI